VHGGNVDELTKSDEINTHGCHLQITVGII
jgi:hypothetical protein